MDLKGAVALVTGGNGGLGQRICHALAREGANIAVVYARSREPAEAVAAELAREHRVEAAAFACDVTDGASVERLVSDVTGRFGHLDILVNDAAYNKAIPSRISTASRSRSGTGSSPSTSPDRCASSRRWRRS